MIGRRWGFGVAAAVLWLAPACASGPGSGSDGPSTSVRFAIEVADGTHPPVYVQLESESEPVGWVTAWRDGARVHTEPRCEIPDCGGPQVVCGARIPRVRRVADRDRPGAVEYVWDGVESAVEGQGAAECERRVPAPAGRYTARFCYAHAARIEGEGDPAAGAVGRLVEPVCVERGFELGRDGEVVLGLP